MKETETDAIATNTAETEFHDVKDVDIEDQQ